MQPYPLPLGCVFREDFTSPDHVARNGGVITGTGLANGRFRPTGTGRIEYFNASHLCRLTKFTVAARVNCSAFTGSYRTLAIASGSGGTTWQCGFKDNANTLFWNSGSIVQSSAFSVGLRSVVWAFDGAGVSYFQDGLASGTSVTTLAARVPVAFNVGNIAGGTQPFSEYMRTLQIYSTVFTAADALDWHRSELRA